MKFIRDTRLTWYLPSAQTFYKYNLWEQLDGNYQDLRDCFLLWGLGWWWLLSIEKRSHHHSRFNCKYRAGLLMNSQAFVLRSGSEYHQVQRQYHGLSWENPVILLLRICYYNFHNFFMWNLLDSAQGSFFFSWICLCSFLPMNYMQ